MSTQPRPAFGATALVALPLAALSASRSDATPWPEPFGRAKLQSPAASGWASLGSGTMLFAAAQPSVGVMFSLIAPVYREIYQLNPIAAVVLASRNILLEGIAPPATLLVKLAISSVTMLTAGAVSFRKLQAGFYNYL